jgi:hypothetical protein
MGDASKDSKLGMYWTYRVGDYRIVARIKDRIVRVLVLKIDNGREVSVSVFRCDSSSAHQGRRLIEHRRCE